MEPIDLQTFFVSIISLITGIVLSRYIFKSNSNNNNKTDNSTTTTTDTPKPINNENSDDEDFSSNEEDEEDVHGIYCKQVLLIRTDLPMTKGKVAAQCCHASLGAYQQGMKSNKSLVKHWLVSGAAKITLKVQSLEQILAFQDKANKAGLINYLVLDAGHTQIPSGSATVLAIGPGPENEINEITGKLSLF
ncbi:hypothetical protein DLAC_04013 [Tieghemostelium lacteum]|uniref:peptidyl-tRNA hydrolase n=1 Tax=Tieghemostelium lacteum TaxID=361077 RepID=A0A151ZS07_TIELA|nr:hypothetical protein DLAC_04013 [Tieghemostelium lacteum]|eukprot:KYQ96718.1 hypothetical protein DLAC_04013 [Tieghemostelium lacteum]